MPAGHIMEGEWSLPGRPPICINISDVIDLIKLRNIKPETLDILDVAYKDLSVIDESSTRYKLANTIFPVIVIKGMVNPYNKKYRLIDGRHRLLKLLNNGNKTIESYVLVENDVERFYYYV